MLASFWLAFSRNLHIPWVRLPAEWMKVFTMGAPLKLNGLATFLFFILYRSSNGFCVFCSWKYEMDSSSREHKATVSCISSLLSEGETDWVLRQVSLTELPGLHWSLSSDWVRGQWRWKREGRGREWKGSGKAGGGLVKCDGWFCGEVGWVCVGCICRLVGWVSCWWEICSWVGDLELYIVFCPGLLHCPFFLGWEKCP